MRTIGFFGLSLLLVSAPQIHASDAQSQKTINLVTNGLVIGTSIFVVKETTGPCLNGEALSCALMASSIAQIASAAATLAQNSSSYDTSAADSYRNMDNVQALPADMQKACNGKAPGECINSSIESSSRNLAQIRAQVASEAPTNPEAAKMLGEIDSALAQLSGLSSPGTDNVAGAGEANAADLSSRDASDNSERNPASRAAAAAAAGSEAKLATTMVGDSSGFSAALSPLGLMFTNSLDAKDPQSGTSLSVFQRITRRYQGHIAQATDLKRDDTLAHLEKMRKSVKIPVAKASTKDLGPH